MAPTAPSLATRAALAVALLIGFYLLAFGLAALLAFLPYAEVRWAHRLDARVLVLGLGGAGVILYSAFPRSEAFRAPGPRLQRDEQPRLFELIQGIAGRVGQRVPSEVYLVPDVNAWVAQRGGVFGSGGRRYMGVGLALLQVLDVSELRAVLAHEFGHFDGGDTKLGTFVFQARSAIGRTVQHLSQSGRTIGALQAPFVSYGNMFLRVTQKISRAQELRADALAAEVAGPAALKSGLCKIHALAPAYDAYLKGEHSPVIGMRLVPPAGDGFARFLAAPAIRPQVQEACARIVDLERERAAKTPEEVRRYESHPRLHERLEAIDQMAVPDQPEDPAPAIGLLDDVPEIDAEMSRGMLRDDLAEELDDASWDDVGMLACLPNFREQANQVAPILRGERIVPLREGWPALRERLLAWMRGLPAGAAPDTKEGRQAYAQWLLGAALAVTMVDHGATLFSLPGEPVTARGTGGDAEPFDMARALDEATWTEAEWEERCRRHGLADAALLDSSVAGS